MLQTFDSIPQGYLSSLFHSHLDMFFMGKGKELKSLWILSCVIKKCPDIIEHFTIQFP